MAKPNQDASSAKVAHSPVGLEVGLRSGLELALESELDSPLAPSVRECSDRVAAMERELRDLRARFANVSGQRGVQARAS